MIAIGPALVALPDLAIFANLKLLALPMGQHDGQDQKDLNQTEHAIRVRPGPRYRGDDAPN